MAHDSMPMDQGHTPEMKMDHGTMPHDTATPAGLHPEADPADSAGHGSHH